MDFKHVAGLGALGLLVVAIYLVTGDEKSRIAVGYSAEWVGAQHIVNTIGNAPLQSGFDLRGRTFFVNVRAKVF